MNTIHKFGPFFPGEASVVQMPRGSKVVSAGWQGGQMFAWALVDTDKPLVKWRFIPVGTGWDLADLPVGVDYIDTLIAKTGFVWHLYGGLHA